MPRSDPELALFQMFTELPPEAWPRCVEWMQRYAARHTHEGWKGALAIETMFRALLEPDHAAK